MTPSRHSASLGCALFLVPVLLPMVGGDMKDTDDGGAEMVVYDSGAAAHQGAPTSSSGSGDRWVRHPLCVDWMILIGDLSSMRVTTDGAGMPTCATGEIPNPTTCDDGSATLAPWLVSRLRDDGTYAPWEVASGYQCAEDILLSLAEEAWASMPIAPNTYDVQPEGGYAVAELGVNLIVDTNPRTMDVTLLGTPVTIRAVPTLYTWTNTDGTVWTSTDPGKPYADGGEPFTFPRRPEHRTTFTLTTTWRGEFTTNGGATWRDAPGTATTTSGATTVHVYNPHTHRVDCDLDGNCVNGTQGGGNQKTVFDPDGDGILNYQIPDHKIDDYLTTRDAEKRWTDPERKPSL